MSRGGSKPAITIDEVEIPEPDLYEAAHIFLPADPSDSSPVGRFAIVRSMNQSLID